ncbi:MAG: Glutamate racemase 2 [Saprospiraceae bacterium]|nr:Glutamate racemase 2 [Saprospiraceae bacterium]
MFTAETLRRRFFIIPTRTILRLIAFAADENRTLMQKNHPIGFFDSGIGGLTVLYEALKILPNERYIYFSDGDNAPYGTRPKEEVRELALNAVEFIANQGVKALVVACNTATSVAIEDMRRRYDFPVIGMEPAVKPAVMSGNRKRVLVFATELTLKEEKFKNLVARVDTEQLVDYLPLQELVMYAERFEFDALKIIPYLQNKLDGIDLSKYGAVVLGCTHFIFFKKFMEKVLPPEIQIIDGNRGTVNNLKNKLGILLSDGPGSVSYFLSGKAMPAAQFERFLQYLELQETAISVK